MIATDVAIPFKTGIGHHLKQRTETEAFVVIAETEDGVFGFGEGAPRDYVTAESLPQINQRFISEVMMAMPLSIRNVHDIKRTVGPLNMDGSTPALKAAVEMALLDAMARSHHGSIAHFFDLEGRYVPQYSGVLPYMSTEKFERWLHVIAKLDMPHVKIKVGTHLDITHLNMAREILGDDRDIRVDANRAWSFAEACIRIEELAQFGISCVEEPLRGEDINKLPLLASVSPLPIVLDESIFNMVHARYYAQSIPADKLIYNLKLSKCGGILTTHEIHTFARSEGIRCQLGCNVGETAILSAAGRLFAQYHNLAYLEGSYASFFMEDDLSSVPMTFGERGLSDQLTGPGLGIPIDISKVQQYSSKTQPRNLTKTVSQT